jgi:hypothetical protein
VDGEPVGSVIGHTDEASVIKMDYLNRLLISGGIDGNIFIYKEDAPPKTSFSKLREIYLGKPIKNLEVSVYHNIIAVIIKESHEIFLLNYELGRVFTVLSLPNSIIPELPTSIEFINTYSVSRTFRLVILLNISSFNRS